LQNIYQYARESAGFTQERAAELFDISVESIRAYETEKRIPPDRVVVQMIDKYHVSFLAYQHLKYKTGVGNMILPDITQQPLSNAALSLIYQMNQCLKEEEEIIRISMDGKITVDEKADWERIKNELFELCTAILTVQFSD
jgi:transcriptional regulator with XRE-family HTH domain